MIYKFGPKVLFFFFRSKWNFKVLNGQSSGDLLRFIDCLVDKWGREFQ